MSNQALISAGVLNTYWDHKHTDMLDLIMPFLKYSISQTTKIGEEIDLTRLTEKFRSEYGYDDMPIDVIRIMLKRLSPTILKKVSKHYILSKSLEEDAKKYENKKIQYKERINNVILSLQKHLNNNIKGAAFQYEQVGNMLYGFFIQNGLIISHNMDELSIIKFRDGKTNYEIARFILNEHKNNSIIFNYILEMIQGFFVSTAISLQNPSTSNINEKIRRCVCFIDTRLLIDALGLHSEIANRCSLELFEMLRNSGAELKCFEHNYVEIQDVLKAYKRGLTDPRNNNTANTLEFFDEQGYNTEDVERYRSLLRSKIEGLGISIENAPEYDYKKLKKEALIDEKSLENQLISEKISTQQRHAAEIDVKSASAIMRLRNGERPVEFEKCGYIFISSNSRFCKIASKYLNQKNGECIPAVVSDSDISAIMWLKNYRTHKDYPKSKLLENAMITLEPSNHFLSRLYEEIDKIAALGGISDDEAAILRTDLFYKREAVKSTQGDVGSISSDTIMGLKEKLRNDYEGSAREESNINFDLYRKQKELNLATRKKAISEIEKIGEITFEHYKKIYSYIAKGIGTFLIIGVIMSVITGIAYDSIVAIVSACLLGFFTVLGAYDSLISRKRLVQQYLDNRAREKRDLAMDQKRDEYEKILGKFESE